MSDVSGESTYQSQSLGSSVKNYDIKGTQRVAIFDWDDTLFCTKYIEALQLNLVDIFTFKTSFEENFSYLKKEFEDLQNVSQFK